MWAVQLCDARLLFSMLSPTHWQCLYAQQFSRKATVLSHSLPGSVHLPLYPDYFYYFCQYGASNVCCLSSPSLTERSGWGRKCVKKEIHGWAENKHFPCQKTGKMIRAACIYVDFFFFNQLFSLLRDNSEKCPMWCLQMSKDIWVTMIKKNMFDYWKKNLSTHLSLQLCYHLIALNVTKLVMTKGLSASQKVVICHTTNK